jgi:hypothetical protein
VRGKYMLCPKLFNNINLRPGETIKDYKEETKCLKVNCAWWISRNLEKKGICDDCGKTEYSNGECSIKIIAEKLNLMGKNHD